MGEPEDTRDTGSKREGTCRANRQKRFLVRKGKNLEKRNPTTRKKCCCIVGRGRKTTPWDTRHATRRSRQKTRSQNNVENYPQNSWKGCEANHQSKVWKSTIVWEANSCGLETILWGAHHFSSRNCSKQRNQLALFFWGFAKKEEKNSRRKVIPD